MIVDPTTWVYIVGSMSRLSPGASVAFVDVCVCCRSCGVVSFLLWSHFSLRPCRPREGLPSGECRQPTRRRVVWPFVDSKNSPDVHRRCSILCCRFGGHSARERFLVSFLFPYTGRRPGLSAHNTSPYRIYIDSQQFWWCFGSCRRLPTCAVCRPRDV